MPNGITPSSYDEAIALADRMASNPVEATTHAQALVDILERLPPDSAELLSRYVFERSSLWTLGVSFENVDPDGEAPTQNILCQHDVWIRGVVMTVIPKLRADQGSGIATFIASRLQVLRAACLSQGTNGRFLAEVNWRVDSRQGFIQEGQSEILGPGTLVAGDGFWYAPLDWRLQKDQTISVRLASRMRNFFPDTLDPAVYDDTDRILRWVTVNFWAEELNQPSVR